LKKHKLLVIALAFAVVLGAFAGCTTDDPLGEQMEEEAAYYQGEISDAAELQYALDEGMEDITLQDDIEADEIEASSEFDIDGDGYEIDATFVVDIDDDSGAFDDVDSIDGVNIESAGTNTVSFTASRVGTLTISGAAAVDYDDDSRPETLEIDDDVREDVTVNDRDLGEDVFYRVKVDVDEGENIEIAVEVEQQGADGEATLEAVYADHDGEDVYVRSIDENDDVMDSTDSYNIIFEICLEGSETL